jgi:CHAT domain-containing protein
MPYEMLHDDAVPLAVRYPLFRQVEGCGSQEKSLSFHLFLERLKGTPLKILLISSADGESLKEIRRLDELLREELDRIGIEVDLKTVLDHRVSYEKATEWLTNCQYHIVHYAGHSHFDRKQPENSGLLLWHDEQGTGKPDLLPARALAGMLRDSQTVFFYLSSCVGARIGSEEDLKKNDYLGVMDAILQAGVPGVLGFRWDVTNRGAKAFAEYFYSALFETKSPETAALYARGQVYAKDGYDPAWLSPILVMQNI